MSTHELDRAVKMLEQISANFAWDEDPERAATAVASHVQRFWSPEMRRMVTEAVSAGRCELSPLAARAASRI